jgi:hypothetical protein
MHNADYGLDLPKVMSLAFKTNFSLATYIGLQIE